MEGLGELKTWVILAGCVLISVLCAVVGTFTYLRKQSLLGDVIAHSLLPGICLSFMWSGQKDIWLLLAGGACSGGISVYLSELLKRTTKLSRDTISALVLSVFFAVGVVLLTMIQQQDNASQSGLGSFLFGKAASITVTDLYTFAGIAFPVLLLVLFLFRQMKLHAFDPVFFEVTGLPGRLIRLTTVMITVITVAVGINTVGVVLVAALLVTPVASARFWTFRLGWMIGIAVVLSISSSVAGTWISARYSGMPTGPWIVVCLAILAVISFVLGSEKGLVVRLRRRKKA